MEKIEPTLNHVQGDDSMGKNRQKGEGFKKPNAFHQKNHATGNSHQITFGQLGVLIRAADAFINEQIQKMQGMNTDTIEGQDQNQPQ